MKIVNLFNPIELTKEEQAKREFFKQYKNNKNKYEKNVIDKKEYLKISKKLLIDGSLIGAIKNIDIETEKIKKIILEKEHDREFNKLKKAFWKNPTKVITFMDEAFKLMEKAVKNGIMTKEEHDKTKRQIESDLEKANKIIRGFRK